MPPKVANVELRAAVYANSFRTVAVWANSIGLRTASFRQRAQNSSGLSRVAEEFLINSRQHRGDPESEASIGAYFTDNAALMLSLEGREEVDLPTIDLPPQVPLRMSFSEVIQRRRSCRSYTGDPILLDELSTLLHSAAGVTGTAHVPLREGGEVALNSRATPSGGGLYPVTLYVTAIKVGRLARGLYRFSPLRNQLLLARPEEAIDALLRSFSVPDEVISLSRAAAIFFLVGQPWKAMRKYGHRGMRLLLHEVGAMAEHLNLSAVALGLGSVDCAAVYDDEAHEALGIDGLYHALLHAVVVGQPG